MSSQPNSLWPEDFGTIAIVPPVVILKEQAGFLSQMTKNIVEGEVRSGKDGTGHFSHSLSLLAPALGGYRYELLRITHDIRLYPTDVVYLPGSYGEQAASEQELKEILRKRFADDRTKKVLQALIAQSRV
jgi:hypothetical protein